MGKGDIIIMSNHLFSNFQAKLLQIGYEGERMAIVCNMAMYGIGIVCNVNNQSFHNSSSAVFISVFK